MKNIKSILSEGGNSISILPDTDDGKKFVAKHKVKKTADANKNGDDVFNAKKVKTYKGERHGYSAGEDVKVYEEKMTSSDKAKEKRLKDKYDESGMKDSMQKQYGKEKGKQIYFATIRKKAMEAVELDEGFKEKISGIIRREKQKSMPFIQTRTDTAMEKAAKSYAAGDTKKGDKYMNWREKSLKKEETDLTENLGKASKKMKFWYNTDPRDVKNRLKNADPAFVDKLAKQPEGKLSGPAELQRRLAVKMKKESVELDEGVAADTYDKHHGRAVKAANEIAQHLTKHKKIIDDMGKDNSYAHEDRLWDIKGMSQQLEDMAHNLKMTNERLSTVPKKIH